MTLIPIFTPDSHFLGPCLLYFTGERPGFQSSDERPCGGVFPLLEGAAYNRAAGETSSHGRQTGPGLPSPSPWSFMVPAGQAPAGPELSEVASCDGNITHAGRTGPRQGDNAGPSCKIH